MTSFRRRPLVWYVGTGYALPAGIEAHILHYATEMRNHGFETRVVVFKELPAEKHRFLAALDDRGIPIVSLTDAGRRRAGLKMKLLRLPWLLYTRLLRRVRPTLDSFRLWALRRESMLELRRRLRRERPDLIHIFGRLPTHAWREFPAERTIFHEMMTGTVDRHWNEDELREFRGFASRVARYFAPGSGVAANVKREFGVTRRIDPIFTMCPDEAGAECGVRNAEWQSERMRTAEGSAGSKAEASAPPFSPTPHSALRIPHSTLRFGVICRLTGQKGIQFLLPALKAYRDRHGDVQFLFGGLGPMEEDIRQFAEEHGLANVKVARVPSAPEILSQIDVFVHPSVDDAMPVAIAEALMCGRPCVVCRVGGCADLVRNEVEGLVIEPHRPDLILQAMDRFAHMPDEQYQALSHRARLRYEEVCCPAAVGHEVAEHYRAILESLNGRQK